MADPSQSLAARGGYSIADLTRPIFTSKVPYSEWAGRVRYGAEIDTSRIENTVRAADVGIMWPMADMAREMLGLNPKAAGIVNKGLMPLAAADWDLTPAEGDGIDPAEAARIATEIREIVKAIPDLEQAILDLAWGFFDGRAGLEKQLVRRPTGTGFEVWCERLDWIQPQRLSFEESRRLIVVDRWGDYGLFTRRGPVLDDVPGKFITFTPRMFGDLQEREGLAPRYLYWLLFDRVNWRQRFLVSEQFGIPWRLIETQIAETLAGMKLGLPTRQDGGEGGAPGDDGVALDYAVQEAQNVVRDGVWAGLPGQKLRVEFPPDSVREFFSQGSDQILERLAFLTLHNSLSAAAPDNEAGRAGAVVNLGGENTVLDFRGRLVSRRVQAQLIDVLVELNFGAAALPYSPKFQLRTQPPRDRDKETDRVLKVASSVPVGAGSLYEASGVRPPNKGEDLVTPPAPAGGAPGLPFGEGGAGSSPAALPHGESGSEDANGAIRDLVESADEDDQAAAADAEADGGHLARFFATPGRLVQPATVHGSPDTLVERGVREAVRFTSAWADELVDAVTGDDPARIYRNLAARERTLDVEPFTRALERRIVHTLMLGALDADHEATSDVTIAPATFDGGGRDFTALPFGEAIKAFADRKVMTRRQFDRLTADAKRKAFTVAGLTTKRMLTTAHDELQKAITAGADLREFSKSLGARFDAAGWTRLNPSHVENVFRTNVMGAYSDGRRAQMTQPHVLAARPYWQILGVDDARTRKTHAEAHGKVLPANDPFFARSGPPFGFQCFAPSSLMQGAIVGASRAFYEGKAVELRTAKGRRLTVTAGHPVATVHGLVAAGELRPGDQLLGYGGHVEHLPATGDEHHAPTRAEEVFGALANACGVLRTQAGRDDFHGEAARFHGEIDVVGTYGELLLDAHAASSQGLGDLELVPADATSGSASGRDSRSVAPSASTDRAPRAPALPLDGGAVRLERSPLRELRFGPAAELDAPLFEDSPESLPTTSGFARELLERCAGAVELDELVNVRDLDWSGHVYDFQSATGWLVADGIVTSNCRCRVISRSKKDLERLGLTPTFGAALKGLPDPGWSADAIAPPASYEPEDGPPPKAAPPAYRPAPFKDLPVEPLPKTEQPPEGAKGYLAFQKEQLAKCSAGEVKAIRSFTHGFDWTIREIDKGRSTDDILAGIAAERARMPDRKWRTTPEQHLEQAKAYHRDLYSALRRMAPVSERTVLRGLRALDAATFKAILASEHVEIGAVSSASWDLNVAAHFAEVPYATDGAHSVLFKLKAKSARAIESVSKHRDERELLLMKGTRFRVVRVYRPEGAGAAAAAVVEAEEI